MTLNPSLFDRIRISATDAEAEPARPEEQRCESPGCMRKGEFRAPKGRGQEGRYFRFCLDHVKAYNATYNYFSGMTDDAVADYQKEAVIGHRPTWKLGVNSKAQRMAEKGAGRREGPAPEDVFDIFGRGQKARQEATSAAMPEQTRRAYDAMGLEPSASGAEVKARYKELVKRFHPDANGGDRSREERLQEIIRAYGHLKASRRV